LFNAKKNALPGHFTSLKKAMEWVKAKRLEELYTQFPPRHARYASSAFRVPCTLGVFCVIVVGAACAHGGGKTWVLWLDAICIALVVMESALSNALERAWAKRHPRHPFTSQDSRDEAVGEATDPVSLRNDALQEMGRYAASVLPLASEGMMFRADGGNGPRVRIVLDLEELQQDALRQSKPAISDAEPYPSDSHIAERYASLVRDTEYLLTVQRK
jgi:hypothetical protein